MRTKKILYYILTILIIILFSLIYARFIGPIGLNTKEIPYHTKTIDDGYNGLKIIHFSDLYYKNSITNKQINNVIEEINRLKPDIVIFTGGLVNEPENINSSEIKFLIKKLSKIESTYGNFAILGKNDYKDLDLVKSIYIQSNFTILDNDYSIIHNENNEQIFIGGVSSYLKNEADIDKVMNYFNENPDINFKIVLTHEGDYINTILNKYHNINMILSGNSINGSINIPGIKQLLLPDGYKNYYKPYYKKNNTDIYISNGIGFNNLNLRLFNHPSINFYRIKKAS